MQHKQSPKPRRSLSPLVRRLALLSMALPRLTLAAATPLPPSQPRLVPAETYLFRLPYIANFTPPVVDIIANPSFENEHWETDYAHGGNQWPVGWAHYSPDTGELMPFPTKSQGGNTIEARSGGWGEYVHKYYWQLPDNERPGAIRALIIAGQLTYKIFSDHIPYALVLSQTLHHTPGHIVKVTGHILGETSIPRCSGSGILEPDHFIASLQLGSAVDTRLYAQMKDEYAVPGNERPWNIFEVTAQFPANGELPLKYIVQSNWGCEVNFFVDHFEARDLTP